MPGERYVVLGLAQARSGWFRDVAQWATSSGIPAEFIKCVSAEEVRARLAGGRPHSALLVDTGLPAFDRDLVAAASAADTPVIGVSDGRIPVWSAADLGLTAVLAGGFGRDELMDVLGSHTRMIGRGDELPAALAEEPPAYWRGALIGVCGPGGTGVSTVAIALAQALAADARYGRRVALADLALRADQAMLHDARDLGPGLQELVEAHRLGRPSPQDIRQITFDIPERGYRLLLGLRRSSAWSALRPRAFDAALDGLRRTFQAVVADVAGDVEGEADGGSIDVEERNHMSRSVALRADAIFVVGAPGMKGSHSLAQALRALLGAGVAPARLQPVINRAPRHPRARAELAAALAHLVGDLGAISTPVYVPERKIEDVLRRGGPLPRVVVGPLAGALRAVLDRQADDAPAVIEPVRVALGSLGSWSEADDVDAS